MARLYGGYSDMLYKVPVDLGPEFESYMKRLKSGRHIGLEGTWYFKPKLGAGIDFTWFGSGESQDSLLATNGFFTIRGNISDRINILNVSPTLNARLPLFQNRLQVSGGCGPTYMYYHNVGHALTDSATFRGSSAGFTGKIALETEVVPGLWIGAGSAYLYSKLKKLSKITISGTEIIVLSKEEYQDISRIDVFVALSYRFGRKYKQE